MAFPSSGIIRASDINTEFGRSLNQQINLNEQALRKVVGRPTNNSLIQMSNFYNKNYLNITHTGHDDIFYDGDFKVVLWYGTSGSFTINSLSPVTSKNDITWFLIGGGGGGGNGNGTNGGDAGGGGGGGGYAAAGSTGGAGGLIPIPYTTNVTVLGTYQSNRGGYGSGAWPNGVSGQSSSIVDPNGVQWGTAGGGQGGGGGGLSDGGRGGNDGNNSFSGGEPSNRSGGGGGGNNEAGANANLGFGGRGGRGVNIPTEFTIAASGNSRFGAGGGGGQNNTGSNAPGGEGGGGNGAGSNDATPGNFWGGGGGGGSTEDAGRTSAARGANGAVLIRYRYQN